ncbi:MAG: ribose 5-phosphate isomerase B [Cryomorphaceae bacterium]|nr:ribose 5-phosphate isomerase B [Cryomorphaceae bacterium]
MNFSLGSDHAGFKYKEAIKTHILSLGHKIEDCGSFSEESVDYADFGHRVARNVESRKSDFGIVLCGSGNGINMTVNKHQGIRGALCWLPELAALARQHNDANVLALPARFIELETAMACIDAFINASFEGGRHALRIEKIPHGGSI